MEKTIFGKAKADFSLEAITRLSFTKLSVSVAKLTSGQLNSKCFSNEKSVCSGKVNVGPLSRLLLSIIGSRTKVDKVN